MIEALQKIADGLEDIRNDMPGIIGLILERNKDIILDLNRLQLLQGKRADGSDLPPGVDLYQTGAFQRSFDLSIFGDYATVIARDAKDVLLTRTYGDEIKGLPEEHADEFLNTVVLPGIAEEVSRRLNSLLQ